MNLLPLNQITLPWWIEVYTSVPQQTYQIGPFGSWEEAKIARTAHVEVLDHEESRDIVASIKQQSPDNSFISQPPC